MTVYDPPSALSAFIYEERTRNRTVKQLGSTPILDDGAGTWCAVRPAGEVQVKYVLVLVSCGEVQVKYVLVLVSCGEVQVLYCCWSSVVYWRSQTSWSVEAYLAHPPPHTHMTLTHMPATLTITGFQSKEQIKRHLRT